MQTALTLLMHKGNGTQIAVLYVRVAFLERPLQYKILKDKYSLLRL